MSTPTIISFLDKDVDVSSFYNFSEEEENENDIAFHEIQLISETISYFIFSFVFREAKIFDLHDDLIICNYKASIFIPPPDLI
ncbi:hypothetical protein FIA58_000940 [Flavobacterium jejuense]|uniref:Uncharacterized protein n=1 Tax=Flavobacterium jejuense TaxID=1544455 RepID=A0ABX0IN69_9FLAO|nr:hypothetical protein [Flavobacterium jejuense]NHN24229.1 hypothetical protein [Flavobacterium jejuense]